MSKKLLLMLIIAVIPSTVLGTAQTPDEMLFNGKTHYVYGFNLSTDMVEKRNQYFSNHKNYFALSSNHDGFYATLVIKNKKLFLTVLKIDYPSSDLGYKPPSTKEIFGINIPKDGLFAEWFSNDLTEYYGEKFIAHTRSHERNFYFEKGILVRIEEKENKYYKEYRESLKKQEGK